MNGKQAKHLRQLAKQVAISRGLANERSYTAIEHPRMHVNSDPGAGPMHHPAILPTIQLDATSTRHIYHELKKHTR